MIALQNIHIFFNELRFSGGAIWLKDETIKFSAPKKFHNQKTDEFITSNKSSIIFILRGNQIFSREGFLNTPILRDRRSVQFPLSPGQERLWFFEQYEGGTNAYHIPVVFQFDTQTDVEGIKYALQKVVSRHEVLRSTIEQGDDETHAIQVVHERQLSIEEVQTDVDAFDALIKEDINCPFDLSKEYPIRAKFYGIKHRGSGSDQPFSRTILLVNIHHIASDGWSQDIFQKELSAYYEAYVKNNKDFSLPALEIQYRDYALWQRSYLTGKILETQLNYWKQKLSGYQTLELPTDHPRPNQIDYKGAFQEFTLDKDVSKKLRALAKRYGVTLNSVLLSSINILLHKYTGQDDIVIGSPIANRHYRQTEGVIGFFVNTQVNRTLLSKNQSFEGLIQQVHQEQIIAQLYQDLPFEKLVDELRVERDASRHPVFQVLFAVQSYGIDNNAIQKQGESIKPFRGSVAYEVAKLDLSIYIDDSQEALTGLVSFATSLFHKDSISSLIQRYTHLIDQLAESPQKAYSQLSLLNPEEHNQIVYQWNNTEKEYPKDKTIYELFQEQVVESPDSIALVCEGDELSYNQLNQKSNQLARHIRAEYLLRTGHEMGSNTLIALCLNRSLEMVIGILAVMKAGGAYVPIDPSHPRERIDYVLADIKAELVLTQKHLVDSNPLILPADKAVYVDLTENLYSQKDTSNLRSYSSATDLAYVMYTSGTTGRPKGVMIEHRGIINLVQNQVSGFGIKKNDRAIQFASYVFDASVSEIFTVITTGAHLYIVPSSTRQDAYMVGEFMKHNRINVGTLPPALLSAMPFEEYPSLRTLVVAGEACPAELMKKWSKGRKLINAYGPTESTVCASMHVYTERDSNTNIGKPLDNVSLYVLDSSLIPVPVGVIGELYIGGAGIARGYLNNEELTKDRFVNNPFATESDKAKGYGRLYKTGDLARRLANEDLEYIGRNDEQVKIRGYRIELGEIEHALSQVAGIKQSCVLVKEKQTSSGNTKYLVAYYVLDSNDAQAQDDVMGEFSFLLPDYMVTNTSTLTPESILDQLSSVLPAYMIPTALIAMESFPLTINGKLDKRALPDPEFSSKQEDHVVPATEIEVALCELWQQMLGVERVGVTDDFFRIGGNSILAIQVSHRMSKILGSDVKVADIFKKKTISELMIHSLGKEQVIIPKNQTDRSVLSFAQERLWFIEQYEEGTNAYHIPTVFELASETDALGVKHSIQQIIKRHEILRSTIEQGEGQQGIQVVHTEPLFIGEVELTDEDDYRTILQEDINRPFDLSKEYPIRVNLYRLKSQTGEERRVLLINTHHIASDGWSVGIFHGEFFSYYKAYVNGDTEFSLPPLEIQYKDYAIWQKRYLQGEALSSQLNYWKNKLSGHQPLQLPTDNPRPAEIDYRGAGLGFALDKDTSAKARSLAQRYGVTMNTVLLSGLNILLNKYTGQEDIVVGSVIANRHHRQTEGLIGFFVNTQAIRTVLKNSQSFSELIHQVHQDQIEAQLHQDLPFEKLVDELGVERDTSRHPVFQVMFGVEDIKKDQDAVDDQNTYLKGFEESLDYAVEKFDLSINIYDGNQELHGYISYATSLFSKETIERFVNHYVNLLTQLIASPEQPYSELSLLLQEEYDRILYQWNATDKDYPRDQTIHAMFEAQVRKTPDHIALVFEGSRLTYRELNERSNQLARHLGSQYQSKTKEKLGPDTLVALYLERSLEMVIGILGVLKAGGAYVPIDPSYPQERIDYLLEDTNAELVLSQRQVIDESKIQLSEEKIVYIDLSEELYTQEDPSNLPSHSSATDLAYVIYTSGTTGKPKGVMVEHRGVINLLVHLLGKYNIEPLERFLLFSNYIFDASIEQIFLPLFSAGTLFIVDNKTILDRSYFTSFVRSNRITQLDATPSYLSVFDPLRLNVIKRVSFGGEYLPKDLHRRYSTICTVINGYGPTETTITSHLSINSYLFDNRSIGNVKTYVLDSNRRPVPIGVIGELYIGGAGVARGYLNNTLLTEERFVPNEFATDSDKVKGYTRLYKTGDLVRWVADGNLEYIGRNDDQVKISGYRIELGEIENALTGIAGIKQSCVLVRERKTESGSTKYLVGYYVAEENSSISEAMVESDLSKTLPEYMIPTAFVRMSDFPLTVNGKLDKRALPEVEFSSTTEDYVAPKTDLEIRLSTIYAEVLGLGIEKISTHRNFFKMGGSSILVIQLKYKLSQQKEFKYISVADLFKYNTISKLVENVQQGSETVYKLQEKPEQKRKHEIAIIGLSGAFSGASTVTELWDLVSNQREGIQFFSKDECKEFQLDEALVAHPDYVPVAGKVSGIELFDPSFWGLSPNEAKLLDPQIRKFVEHCWFALESSGYSHKRKTYNIGVFAGSGDSNYLQEHILEGGHAEKIDRWEAMISNSKDALVTKTAYLLGLSGPANSINTACSTGLVSVVEACKNLQLGICDMALAGGVSLSMPDQIGYIYQPGMIASSDGHCRTFDKDASGATGGSGVGVVLLKRLEDAVKDGDNIIAVIKGYATNNDGDRKTGYTAPSVIGQSECIINAQLMAGVTSDQVEYIECHGTATQLGDPIEVQALREAFEYNRKNKWKKKTILGSVKANIGHTDSAAGTAGLIKVCAMLQNNVIPGQVNFNYPNPELNLDRTNFEITKENKPWLPSHDRQRIAGVSSFGIGGTNAHVIIGDYPATRKNTNAINTRFLESDTRNTKHPFIIPLSAKSRESLHSLKNALLQYIDRANGKEVPFDIGDVAYTLQARREHFEYRSAYCATDFPELISKLNQEVPFIEAHPENGNKVAFMFPGQGAQYINMAKALYKSEAFFRTTIDQCIQLANPYLDQDLGEVMYPSGSASHDINDTKWSQISLFTIEYALAKFLEHLGVKADIYIGHSIGEYVAATLSGVFKLEDAVKVVIARGKLMQKMKRGSMLAINAKGESLISIIKASKCEIAVINSIDDIVASGIDEDIEKLEATLQKQSIPVIKLSTSHAYHSAMMQDAAVQLEVEFDNIKLSKPTKDFVCNVTGKIANEEVSKPSYWSKQLRNTVQFAKGIETVSTIFNHHGVFIEVGPGKGLTSFVKKHTKATNNRIIKTLQVMRSAQEAKAEEAIEDTVETKEDIIRKLWMLGIIHVPNKIELFERAALLKDFPNYQFNFKKYWAERSKRKNSTKQLRLLPERKWLSIPTWSAIQNLQPGKGYTAFACALVFIREDLINLYDFRSLAPDFQVVKLSLHDSDFDDEADNGVITINAQNENHFRKLASLISNSSKSFDTIIHASSIDNTSEIDIALHLSFYSLFLIRQHILNACTFKNLVVLTNGLTQITNEDVIYSNNGTLVGAVRNINHEFLGIDARVIDVGLEKNLSYVPVIWNDKTYRKSEELLAIRFGKLWVEHYETIASDLPPENIIADGDAILITGGLGRVGLAIAKYISERHTVKFILVSRSSIHDVTNQSDYTKSKIEIIDRIKANGSIVDVQLADISSLNELSALLDTTQKTHGQISGIIHTAGVSPLTANNYTLANVKSSFRGKVLGIENVTRCIDMRPVKFIACTSSLASVMGDVNRIEYCAANSYLDYLAVDKARFKNTKITSVNWPGWSEDEMAGEGEPNNETSNALPGLQKLMHLNSVQHNEGSALFFKIINQTNYERIAISKLDIKELQKELFNHGEEIHKSVSKHVRLLEDSYTQNEYQLAQIIGEALGIDEISIHDDFFKLGGNSILAIQISHRISKLLGSDVKVADIFKKKTISQLAIDSFGREQVIIPKNEVDRGVLSFAQERLWFIEQYEEGTNAYHIPAVFELAKEMDILGVKHSIQQIIKRHEILRSTIEHDETHQGIQIVHNAPLFIGEVELTDQDDYRIIFQQDVNRPFNLRNDYPIRVNLYTIKSRTARERRLLLIVIHHIATDGWSMGIFQKELFSFYKAYVSNDTKFSLTPLEIQYKDYAIWQKQYLRGEVLRSQLNYWKNKLSGYQTLELPTDYPRPAEIDYKGAGHGFVLDNDISNKVRSLAQRYGLTLNTILLSSINILLGKYTGQEDIVIGSVIANRHHRQTEELIGFFVNTQVNRTILSEKQSFLALIQQVHQDQISAQQYQDLPFEKLVDELGVERDTSRHPIFQVMFDVQDFKQDKDTINDQVRYFEQFEESVDYAVEQFDLSVVIYDGNENLNGHVSYATSLFKKETIERFVTHYVHLLTKLLESPETPYSEFSLVLDEEYNRIVHQWNATDNEYAQDQTIHTLFEVQVEKTPDHIALVYEGSQLTYRELNERSNQLARHLRAQYQNKTEHALTPDTLIVLCLNRSLEMVIGILAVLKAGAAYVPMDPSYTQERMDYILEDTKTEIILSQRLLDANSKLPQDKTIYIDLIENLYIYNREEKFNIPRQSKSTSLAYVIYTSGTTGNPKGVLVNNRSIINLINFHNKRYSKLSENLQVASLSNYIFDFSVQQIFNTLLYGHTLHLIPQSTLLNLSGFNAYLKLNKIEVFEITPTLFSQLLLPFDNYHDFHLRLINIGGESLSRNAIFEFLRKKLPHQISIINTYGPTEYTVDATVYEIDRKDELRRNEKSVLIGKPIDNTKIYVLDKLKNVVPVGVMGELHLGGAGLSMGYLNNDSLTEERFIPNPFATDDDKLKGYTHLYKTGDMVRWLADGNLEYLGRNDDQVKIHGYRIELGEIENALLKIAGIKQSCVLVKERNIESGILKYLVGYYVECAGSSVLETSLESELLKVLPDYMIPSAFVRMPSFPLTVNGKLDKRALPDPELTNSRDHYVVPVTGVEIALCNLWKQVLGVERVGVTNDFFRTGGNSILAIQVSHRMSKILGNDVKVADIFKKKTIAQLIIHSLGKEQVIIPKNNTNRAVLSFSQERLWFVEQYEEGTNAYHMPEVFQLASETDVLGMKHSIQQIISRHEILRSTIETGEDQQGIQVVHDEPLFIGEVTLTDEDDFRITLQEDINRPFDLSKEYPIRVNLFRIKSQSGEDRRLLLINIHHIANDGWSMGIFQDELFSFYKAYINNDTGFNLPPLEIQYKDYAVWQKNYLRGETLSNQLNYWKNKLSGYQPLELPTDYPRPAEIDYKGAGHGFTLDKNISGKLRSLAQRYGVTLNTVLLSSMNILLSKYTGQEDIVIGSVIANRHHRQTEGLIGFFVNTLVNRTVLNKTQTFSELIQLVHQDQIEAQLHQDLPFEKLVDELGVERDTSRHPVFQVMFTVEDLKQDKATVDDGNKYFKQYGEPIDHAVEKFDLSIFIDNVDQELRGYVSYATSLFSQETIERFVTHYAHLLSQLIEAPDKPYSKFSLLLESEYDCILHKWNATDKEYPKDQTIHALFESQVKKTPNHIAVVYEGSQLTYGELNERSNQLARYIRNEYRNRTGQDLVPDTLIALCVERSLEMVIGILAVLKAGGAYVPIDPTYPQDRINYLLEDTKAGLVLTQRHLKEVVSIPREKIIFIDLSEEFYGQQDSSDLMPCSKATDLAYLIYTSGTTGKPKGVMIEHKGVVNLVKDLQVKYLITPSEKILLLANYVFDASCEQMNLSLLSGATLFVINAKIILDEKEIINFIVVNGITHMHATPSYFNSLNPFKLRNVLKRIVFGGEHLSKDLFKKYAENVATVINEYGPTEVTVTSHMSVNSHLLNNIGIQNVKTYVLDGSLIPVPIGVIGELYVGGAGLARGYYNNKQLTSERFIWNPFASESDKVKGYTRLYKTGDLVRWLADGNLEYIGRNDDQIKIRGHRIELGEVELALAQVPSIRQSCVVARERKTDSGMIKYLVGYYITDKEAHSLTPSIISDNLSRVLPEYMVPAVLIAMESFPLTINGKLDKRALPDPDFSSSQEYVAPSTDIERMIVSIWEAVLGLERVGVTDNFFHIGGNSILAIQVTHRMSKALECELRIADVFRLKTIKKLLHEHKDYSGLIKSYSSKHREDVPNLIFTPPGRAGSEMYQDLAELLIEQYNCIGIDNYNIHNESKITSLNQLANRYLTEYQSRYTLQSPIYLLGWSLGGLIALEMAAILESKGHEKITIILLDTYVKGNDKSYKKDHMPQDASLKIIENEMLNKYDPQYVRKVASAFEAEMELANCHLSRDLKSSNVILFKAMIGERKSNNLKKVVSDEELYNNHETKANNVNLVCSKLKIIELDCNHDDILETHKGVIATQLLEIQKVNNYVIEKAID